MSDEMNKNMNEIEQKFEKLLDASSVFYSVDWDEVNANCERVFNYLPSFKSYIAVSVEDRRYDFHFNKKQKVIGSVWVAVLPVEAKDYQNIQDILFKLNEYIAIHSDLKSEFEIPINKREVYLS